MAAQKKHYYVLVFTLTGPVYVTKINWSDKSAEWNKDEKPLDMSKSSAEDIAIGLCCNMMNAVMIESKYELHQPYRYELGDWKWEMNKKGEVEA